jgi:hypothetical protein
LKKLHFIIIFFVIFIAVALFFIYQKTRQENEGILFDNARHSCNEKSECFASAEWDDCVTKDFYNPKENATFYSQFECDCVDQWCTKTESVGK